ncbi:fasciclin domain-containing protein [Gaetbulibacter aquiaggeris]|uniref:Fasciclin domain-containing protein n=1 Tax=Gaetbulibacter aquiaggeris TaxID=1735373 RepID=A0ABW7MKG9_9FLAO
MNLRLNFSKSQVSFLKLPTLLLFVLSLFTISCNTEDTDIIETTGLQPTIVEVLEAFGSESTVTDAEFGKSKVKKPTFKTLNVALAQTGLAGTVSSKRLTVFAPTDAAFAKYGLNQKNIVSELGVETLTSILLYHVVSGTIFSGDLPVNGFVPTLNGAFVEVNVNSGVTINNATVIIADREARNGVIHAIDDVLFPPTNNLVALASSFDPEFSVLLAAATNAGLADTLAKNGPYTVFAPTNQAFMDFFKVASVEAAIDVVNGLTAEDLAPILLYHVVDGVVFSTNLSNGFVPTLNGAAVNVTLDSGVMINDANVIGANVQATNGVVHVIDKVLLPPSSNLVDLASSFDPEFSVLLAAATKAGLADTLTNDGPFTVFAPTNQAFMDFFKVASVEAAIDAVNGLTAEDLAPILLYHVVAGRVYSSDLSSGPVTTLYGSFDLNLDTLTIDDNAMLVPGLLNVQATNGVIHVIDSVLIP